MNKTWKDFTKIYKGTNATREAFSELVLELLNKHFPGKDILGVTEFTEKKESNKYNIISYSGFYLDELTNSRKGQIRKAFNKTIEKYDKEKNQIFAWCFCIPFVLNDDDITWWHNWKKKMKDEYYINIQLFDGEVILELLKKYNLYDKWFKIERLEEEKIKNEINEEEIMNFSDDLIEFDISEDKIEPKKEKKDIFQKTNKINISYTYLELKQQYLDIYNKIEKLQKEDKKYLKEQLKRNNISEIRFNHDDIKINEILTTELFYHAKYEQVNKKYEKALLFYEELFKREDFDDIDTVEEDDLEENKQLCIEKIYTSNQIFKSIYHYTKDELITALESSEAAFNISPNDKKIKTNYYNIYGDALLKQNVFLQARRKYKEALIASPKNKEIQAKAKYCHCLIRSKKTFSKKPWTVFNGISRGIYLFRAKKTGISTDYLKNARKKYWRNTFSGFVAIAALIAVFFLIKSIPFGQKNSNNIEARSAVSIYDVLMKNANYYYDNFSNENAHYIDSAIIGYQRAIWNKPHDSLAPEMLQSAQSIRREYIKKIQENIKLDSAAYFVSMRNPHEGLRLFKYLFDPYDKTSGKYGYVDDNMNIVVPPIFDFDHTRMISKGESFRNGKALVCIKINENSSIYFYIDAQMRRISKKYRN